MDNELSNTTNTGTTENVETEKEGKLSFTQEELDALIQREGDKRVSQALKTAEKKQEQKLREAEKLAKMSEAEKYEFELSKREQAIAEKERELLLAENKNEASKILSEKGLSLSLVDFIVDESAEEMDRKIKILDKAFKQSVRDEVEKRLSSKVPMKSLPTENSMITKEQFAKLSIAELSKLKREQPELFDELSRK